MCTAYKRKNFIISALLCSTFALPVHAKAQDNSAAEPAISSGIEEIIVTAQRRSENLQEVPIAVSAVTASTLERSGITASSDLPQLVPSVQFTRSGPSALFFIRGVGTSNAAAGEEGANAVYIDNVYMGDLSQALNNFNNVERIEVLKGPQGTLFGRNATGGLIHVITRDPGQTWQAEGKVGVANYDKVSGQVYLGGPITDNLGIDFAFTGADQKDGWGYNYTRNEETRLGWFWGTRSKVVWEPTHNLKVKISGDYSKSKDNLALAWRIDDQSVGVGGHLSPGGHNTTANDLQLTRLRTWGVSLQSELDLDFATLTSISALRRNKNQSSLDNDGGPIARTSLGYTSNTATFQQELRLASNNNDNFSWQIGGFYLDTDISNHQLSQGLSFGTGLSGRRQAIQLASKSYAAFAELTYSLTPQTKLTGGLRYTKDKRHLTGDQFIISALGIPSHNATFDDKLSYGELTYRVSLQHQFNDNINAYTSINRGFKSGTYSLLSPASPAVKPQYITAYEVGLKTELLNRALRVNLAAYHYDIDDYQVRSAMGGVLAGASVLLNAAQVKVDGFDLEFEAAPTNSFRLFGGLSVINSRYSSYPLAPFVYLAPAECIAPGTRHPGRETGTPTGGTVNCFGNAKGISTPLAPDFTGSLGASYTIGLSGESSIRLAALYSYNSGYVFESDGRYKQDDFHLLNTSAELSVNESFGLEVWANNLANTKYYAQKVSSSTGTNASLAAPRTYGLSGKFKF